MIIYHLYIKTHNITGLKYLGQTKQNPDKYTGSGVYWKDHLKVHGNNVTTEILGSYNTKKELKEAGIYYSKLWNIIESNEWANLKIEEGEGGFSILAWNKGIPSEHRGKRFYNNNSVMKLYFPGEEPKGWKQGRINKPWNKGLNRSDPRVDKNWQAGLGQYEIAHKPAWNKGLTKDDHRVAKYAITMIGNKRGCNKK